MQSQLTSRSCCRKPFLGTIGNAVWQRGEAEFFLSVSVQVRALSCLASCQPPAIALACLEIHLPSVLADTPAELGARCLGTMSALAGDSTEVLPENQAF